MVPFPETQGLEHVAEPHHTGVVTHVQFHYELMEHLISFLHGSDESDEVDQIYSIASAYCSPDCESPSITDLAEPSLRAHC